MKTYKFTIEREEGINKWTPFMEGKILCESLRECIGKLARICTYLSDGKNKLYYTCEEEEGGGE